MCITKNQRNLLRTVELGDNELFGHPNRSVFRTFESWVLTVIDCSKIAGVKGIDSNISPNITGDKAPVAPVLNTPLYLHT